MAHHHVASLLFLSNLIELDFQFNLINHKSHWRLPSCDREEISPSLFKTFALVTTNMNERAEERILFSNSIRRTLMREGSLTM